MSKTPPKFNTALEVLEYLNDEHLTEEERRYYFAKLRSRGGFEGISFIDKEK